MIPTIQKLWLGLAIAGLIACNDLDKDYAVNPNLRLGFSVDTLSFDTVFTAVGSVTRQFMVYNTNKEALNIETIRLLQDTKSGFRINVDGRNGESFSNVRIAGNDSLYVFVEVTVDPADENQPFLLEDKLEFTFNGNRQSVVLQAFGQDVHLLKGGYVLTQDTVWPSDRPYLIYDSVTVDPGVTLTIEKGAILYMHDKAKWIVNGTLKAIGTLEEPVIFRGDRFDNLTEKIPYDRVPNQWDGLFFGTGSFDNEMEHTIVRNGRNGLTFAESLPEQTKIRITNSQITNMGDSLLTAVNCRIEAVNTEFSNASKSVVWLTGGTTRFIHCTLANYFVVNPGRKDNAMLTLSNKSFPLSEASFDNCIIDGSHYGRELSIDLPEGAKFSYRFNHCAINTKEVEDTAFVSVQFLQVSYSSPNYYKSIGTAENGLFYDFRLDLMKDKANKPLENQPIIGKADPAIATQYPLDRFGIDRTTSEDGPDIGAYEYVPEAENED
ncbi:hypothetical protein FACS189416_1390 [Bacteroidia bacterium]|nr:hypothetical protein FACS189416_1390 [Bacteroidia bacterium]